MRTRSQTKKLALAAKAKENKSKSKDDKHVVEKSIPAKLVKLDNDIMRIIRNKTKKMALRFIKPKTVEGLKESQEDPHPKWVELADHCEIGVLTDDLEMNDLEICILHLPIMYHTRVYVNFGRPMESLRLYFDEIENSVDYFDYIRLPDDINNFKFTRDLEPHNDAEELEDYGEMGWMLDGQEDYIIEPVYGERYLAERRFPSLAYQWYMERNWKIDQRRIQALRRLVDKYVPRVMEID